MRLLTFVALILISVVSGVKTQLFIPEGYEMHMGGITWDNGKPAPGVIVSFFSEGKGRLPGLNLVSDGDGSFRALVPKDQKVTAVATAYQTDDSGSMRILARDLVQVQECKPDGYGYDCVIKLKLSRAGNSIVEGKTSSAERSDSESFINVRLIKEDWLLGLAFQDIWVKVGENFTFKMPAGKYSLLGRLGENCDGYAGPFEIKAGEHKKVNLRITSCWIAH